MPAFPSSRTYEYKRRSSGAIDLRWRMARRSRRGSSRVDCHAAATASPRRLPGHRDHRWVLLRIVNLAAAGLGRGPFFTPLDQHASASLCLRIAGARRGIDSGLRLEGLPASLLPCRARQLRAQVGTACAEESRRRVCASPPLSLHLSY